MKKVALLTVAVMLGAWVLLPSLGFSTAEIGKKEGKACGVCHATPGKPDLNDTGKCYKEKKDIAACEVKK